MEAFIADGHQDIAMALLEEPGRNWARPAPPGRALSLPEARRGGLGLILATIFAPEGYWKGERAIDAASRQLHFYTELLARHEEDVFRVESRGDLALCRPGGPIGIIHLLEGADPVPRPELLVRWIEEGVRIVGLAWNTPNHYSGGTHDDGGLTAQGRALLDVMADERVICDVSHLNAKALHDVLEVATGAVVASHSNADALLSSRRNIGDDAIRAIGERDGIVGVMLYGPLLSEGAATIDDVVAHIDHMVDVAGPRHVALGSDLDGGFRTEQAPAGIDSVADLPKIGDALLERGYAEEQVRWILGENWLRVLNEALPA